MCWHVDDQYYFGDDFLVAPVMNSANKRDVYLPEGEWVNLFSGEKYKGGQWLHDFECTMEEMPVWVRNGDVIPVYPYQVSNTDEMDLRNTEPLIFDETYKGLPNSIIKDIWN